jgi:hypothetical protein
VSGNRVDNPAFFRGADDLDLSVRSANCLKNENIIYVGELVQKTDAEWVLTPNFGLKSLNELKEVLAQIGLRTGMEVPGWPPENIEELAKNIDILTKQFEAIGLSGHPHDPADLVQRRSRSRAGLWHNGWTFAITSPCWQ